MGGWVGGGERDGLDEGLECIGGWVWVSWVGGWVGGWDVPEEEFEAAGAVGGAVHEDVVLHEH